MLANWCVFLLFILSHLKQKKRSKLGSAHLNSSQGENVSLKRKKQTSREDMKMMMAEVNSKPLQQEYPHLWWCHPCRDTNQVFVFAPRSFYRKSNLSMWEIKSPLKLTMWNECRQRAHIKLSAPPECKVHRDLLSYNCCSQCKSQQRVGIFGLVSSSVNLLMKINRKDQT